MLRQSGESLFVNFVDFSIASSSYHLIVSQVSKLNVPLAAFPGHQVQGLFSMGSDRGVEPWPQWLFGESSFSGRDRNIGQCSNEADQQMQKCAPPVSTSELELQGFQCSKEPRNDAQIRLKQV